MNTQIIDRIFRALRVTMFAPAVIVCATSLYMRAEAQQAVSAPPLSIHSKMTTDAWDVFNNNLFDTAIAKADACIQKFHIQAEDTEKKLREKKEVNTPADEIVEADWPKVFARGPLNDVATCYFIQGEANVELWRKAEGVEKKALLIKAKKAYESAAALTYARTWDLGKWFWDPAKTANQRLADTTIFQPSSKK